MQYKIRAYLNEYLIGLYLKKNIYKYLYIYMHKNMCYCIDKNNKMYIINQKYILNEKFISSP